ncbi:hypothetical protein GCM10009780_44170 [Actinomadura alba]
MYAWTATVPDERRGACGVSSVLGSAATGLVHALRMSPGSQGLIQICRLSWLGPYYVYGAVIARAELDRSSGAVVWHEETRPAGTWLEEMSLAVREAIDCMPLHQTSGEEAPRQRGNSQREIAGGAP